MEEFNLEVLGITELPESEGYASITALGDESLSLLRRLGEDGVSWQWSDETFWLFILTDDANLKWTINVIPEKKHPTVTLLSCIR